MHSLVRGALRGTGYVVLWAVTSAVLVVVMSVAAGVSL